MKIEFKDRNTKLIYYIEILNYVLFKIMYFVECHKYNIFSMQ